MPNARQATVEFALRWNSTDAAHTDRLYFDKVNFWRDFFPDRLGESLAGIAAGGSAVESFAAGELEPEWSASAIHRVRPDQIRLLLRTGMEITPRVGRFYPRGMVQGLPDVFSGDRRPFRYLGEADGRATVDLNHPLARYPLAIEGRVLAELGIAQGLEFRRVLFRSRLGQLECPVETVPRRLTDRVAHRPAIRQYLPPREFARWMVLQGHDPASFLQAMGQDTELFRHAVTAVTTIEQDVPALTPFDGQTGPLPSHWSRVMRRGVAPTPLERYARCPFQYFGTDVLGVEPVRLAMEKEPDALVIGILLHSGLRHAYESLVGKGWPATALPGDTVRRVAEEAVVKAAAECEREHPPGHFLLWELAKEQAVAFVLATIASDQAAYAELPYQPIAFELEASGTL